MARRFAFLFAVFCVAVALVPAVAGAHEPAAAEVQVQTGTERVVTGYKTGKRIAPFTESYEVVEPYTFTVTIGTKRVRVAPFTQKY